MTDISISTLAPPQTVAMNRRVPAPKTMWGSSATEGRASRRLVAQWYRDAEGVLAMRWTIAVELDEDNPSTALAA
jgi:hypothetical protein